jgi:hypothetical protein
MLEDVFPDAVEWGSVESWEVDGRPEEQGWQIADEWRDWAAMVHINYSVPLNHFHFVTESFQLRPNKARGAGSDRHMLDPIKVIYSVLGIFEYWNYVSEQPGNYSMEFQEPQTGKRVNSDRLRDLDAWVVGSEHRRDAMRHLVQKVSNIL